MHARATEKAFLKKPMCVPQTSLEDVASGAEENF